MLWARRGHRMRPVVVLALLLRLGAEWKPALTASDGDGHLHGTAATMQRLYVLARDDVHNGLSLTDQHCENWRNLLDHSCIGASNCGKGWLYRRQHLLLVIPGLEEGVDGNDGLTGEWRAGEARTITVVGLAVGEAGAESDCDAADLSMVLRLQGPEALAEAAVPVPGRCAWTVEFQPSLEGVYTFDATLINWKGSLEFHKSRCNDVLGVYPKGSVIMGAVTEGPFYGNFEGCCSLCTRTEGCVAWSATSDKKIADVDGFRCALYSSVTGEAVNKPELRRVVHSGTSREEDAMMYLGPSMAMQRSWCAEENGVVLGSGKQFAIRAPRQAEVLKETPGGGTPRLEVPDSADERPLCRSDLLHRARWVSLEDTRCDLPKTSFGTDGWPVYDKDVFGVTHAEECFLKPDDDAKPPDAAIARGGHVWAPYECRYDVMTTESRQTCLKEMNVTRFLDFGDSLISTSSGSRKALWMPGSPENWKSGVAPPPASVAEKAESGCHGGYYAEEKDEKTGITTRYCSVAAAWQMPAGKLVNVVESFAADVVLSNWAVVHRLWHNTFEEFQRFLVELEGQMDAINESEGHRPRFKFWLSLPFLVSEREPHCVLERAVQYNAAIRDVLEPRGWIEVDWMSMTRKWGFDIPDGMHHGPPPTRMLAYMLIHHICHGAP